MKKKKDLDLAPSRRERKTLGQYILLFFLVLYTLFCALPIVLVFVAAFSDEKTIVQNGFSFIPKKWSLDGINAVLRYGKQLATSYGVTIFITVVGTLVGLLIMAMFAYSISRKDFMLGKFLSVYLLIPMLFSGGQLSCYIIYTSMYGLKDNIALLILPLCVSTMNVIILRTYIANSIPGELMEAAKIDGAGEYRTFFQITLPLLKPSMAAVGLRRTLIMKRKLFAVSMAAAMATSCFAGTAFASDSEPVTIKVTRACFNLANPDSEQVKKVQDAINEYIKDKINVQIELTDIGSGEYTEKANLALANNEINLLWTASWEATIGTNDLVPANAVYDITDLLPGTPLYESMDEGQWEATKYDGKNYFVPVYKDNVEGYDVMFRKDLVDKYGWDISSVKTLADIEPMLADLEAEGLKYPYLSQKTAMFYRYYINDFDFFTADSQSNWVAVDRSTNEVVDTVLTDQYKEFCTLMAKWAEAGYISEDEVTKTTTDTTTQTQDWGISWWTDIPVNAEANSRYNQEVVMTPITDRWAHSTSALGSCYAVTANSTPEEAQACVDFLGLLYTDSKLADLYTFGIEGEDFNYVDGKVEQTDAGKYNHSMWESASATIVTPLTTEPDDKAELYKDFNGGANTSCAAGFRFDKNEVADKYAACQNVFNEYGFALENGGYGVDQIEDTIAQYQAALDEAGYQDVLAAFQAQYDEWKAENGSETTDESVEEESSSVAE